jgi:hypothetical protein
MMTHNSTSSDAEYALKVEQQLKQYAKVSTFMGCRTHILIGQSRFFVQD